MLWGKLTGKWLMGGSRSEAQSHDSGKMSFILHTESFLRLAYFRCEWRWYRDQDTGA